MPKCTNCGGDNTVFFLRGIQMDNYEGKEHDYFKCNQCGIVFLDHVPSAADYEESGYYQRKSSRASKVISFVMNCFYKRRYAVLKKIVRNPSGSRILDIGCGKGAFLDIAKKDGWDVTGIEPTLRSAEYAKKTYDINVITTGLLESHLDDASFNAITMWHVLEHLPNPNLNFKTIYNILSNNGLLIVAVPNIGSFQSKLGKNRWFHLDPPRHITHFTPSVLSGLLESNGFRVIKIDHFSAEFNLIGLYQTLQNCMINLPNYTFNYLKKKFRCNWKQCNRFCIGKCDFITTTNIITNNYNCCTNRSWDEHGWNNNGVCHKNDEYLEVIDLIMNRCH